MTGTRRALVAMLTALIVVLGGGTAFAGTPGAAAAVPAAPAPTAVGVDCDPPEGYAAPPACQVLIARAEAICLEAAPVLSYSVLAEGVAADDVTITWVNPDGEDIVQAGMPLTGQLLWPGTVIQDGVVVDWPGWYRDPTGSWVEHDAYDWTRPEVTVTFDVNPVATVVVDYPPETAVCADPPRTGVLAASSPRVRSGVLAAAPRSADPQAAEPRSAAYRSGVLAATGADAAPVIGVVGLMLLGGTGLVLAARRRAR